MLIDPMQFVRPDGTIDLNAAEEAIARARDMPATSVPRVDRAQGGPAHRNRGLESVEVISVNHDDALDLYDMGDLLSAHPDPDVRELVELLQRALDSAFEGI